VIPLRLLIRSISVNSRPSTDEAKVHLVDERSSRTRELFLGKIKTSEKRWRRLSGTHDLVSRDQREVGR
jgi:hypothetical protein